MSLMIKPILCRAGVMDNYAYIITDSSTSKTAVIDASEAAPIIKACDELHVVPEYILTTHHHFDHVGGNSELKQKYGLQIVAPAVEKDLIEGVDIALSDGDVFALGKAKFRVISAAGHTKGHVLYYEPEQKVLFTGDVLFNLCIGGLFEGTPRQMWDSLQKIKQLPDDVLFYAGHEYTKSCLSQMIRYNDSQPMQLYAKLAEERLTQGKPVSPMRLGLEKQCNPYLLIDNFSDFENIF